MGRAYVIRSVVPNSLRPHGPQPARLLCPWDFPVKNTGMGCHFLLFFFFFLPFPSARGSSQSRNQTCISCVSCIGRWILYQLHQLGSPSGVINLVKLIFPPWLASRNPGVFWKCRRGLRIQAHLNNNVVSYGLKYYQGDTGIENKIT